MHPLITVIIPIYNAERFVRPSVDSVLAQTYLNLEIILVDDGSSDTSGAICDSYAEQDKRVRVIHKSNGGVSSARNAGLDAATGDYIAFVDSDDTIDTDMYDVLFRTIQKSGADMAVCGYKSHKGQKQRAVRVPQEGCFNVPELYEKYLENFVAWASLMTSIWSRLISADLVRAGDQPIRFSVDLHRSEDAAFIVDCLAVAHNDIAFVDICPYHYDLTSNTASLTKTVSDHTLEIPLKKLRENMLAELPQRREEIENVFAVQWLSYFGLGNYRRNWERAATGLGVIVANRSHDSEIQPESRRETGNVAVVCSAASSG